MQTDDGEEASQPSSLTAASVSQSCVSCAGLIPRDWPLAFGLACHGRNSKPVGENEMSLLSAAHRWNLVHGDDLKVCPTEWTI